MIQRIKNWILLGNAFGEILYVVLLFSGLNYFFHLLRIPTSFLVIYKRTDRNTKPFIPDRIRSDQERHLGQACQISSWNLENSPSFGKMEFWAVIQYLVVFTETQKSSLKIVSLHLHVNEHVLPLITLIFHH